MRFSRELWIEREDFMEDPPKKFYRLSPGREVRLRYAYFVTCREVVKDASGEVVELRCTYDPATRGGDAPDGRRPKATLHWVSAHDARARPRCASTTTSSRAPNPDAEGDLFAAAQPEVGGGAAGLSSSRRWRTRPSARRCSSSGWATSAPTPTHAPAGPSSTAR